MYIIYGLLAALFASISTISIKLSLTKSSSILITFYKTVIIFTLSLFFVRNFNITTSNLLILIATGITTTVSWIYYFKTIKDTNIKNAVAIDKLSTIITMIFAFLFLKEKINIISILLITYGIFLMLNIKDPKYLKNGIISVIFLSLTAILSKIGIKEIDIITATFIRNLTILIIITVISFKEIKLPDSKTATYVTVSAVFTVLSWLAFYKGIKLENVSLVMPLEKLNVLFTIIISREKLSKKETFGLTLIVIGTLYLLY